MRKAPRISLALFTSAALLGLAAIPASAAELDPAPVPAPVSDGTSANIEVNAGVLAIDVADALDSRRLDPGTDAEFAVPTVTVTDKRAGVDGWSVSVSLSDFTTDVKDAKPIAANGATYAAVENADKRAGTIAQLSANTVELVEGDGKATAADAVVASGIRGNNAAGWDAVLTVPVPGDTLAGTYAAVLTHSVL